MIKHILLFRLKPEVDGSTKAVTFLKAKAMAEDLVGKIPGLTNVQMGVDFSNTEMSSDMCLIMDFDSRESLAQYEQHPDHTAIIPFFQNIYEERRVVDCEITESTDAPAKQCLDGQL